MVFGTSTSEQVRDELYLALKSEMHGAFTKLAFQRECLFEPKSEGDEMLLKRINEAFVSVTHDLSNIRSIFLRMETLVSVPDIEPNRLATFLAADIDQFYSYIQSIFDYLAEGIVELFPITGRKQVNFANLRTWHKRNPATEQDKALTKLQSQILACDWSTELRNIRNALIHEGAEPLVQIPFREKIIYFQVIAKGKPLLTRETLSEELFSTQMPNYVNFKAYAGVVLGRLVSVLNLISEIFYEALTEKIAATKRAAIAVITIPNMAVPLHYIDYALDSIRGESSSPTLNNSKSLNSNHRFAINRDSLTAFMDEMINSAQPALLSDEARRDHIIMIRAFVDILTNRSHHLILPSQVDQSAYSFEIECVMRRYKLDNKTLLDEMVRVLEWVRDDLRIGKIKSFGQIDVMNATLDDVRMMITPFLTTR